MENTTGAELERRIDLFRRWYVEPLSVLETEVPRGDGGLITLAVSLMLFEWYATARSGKPELTKAEIARELGDEFGLDEGCAKDFWNVFRNGLAHSGIPKKVMVREDGRKLPGYDLSHDYPVALALNESVTRSYFEVQPWLLRDHVLRLWKDNYHLLVAMDTHPFPEVR